LENAETTELVLPGNHVPNYSVLPVHPWEARLLLSSNEVQEGIRTGIIQDMGELGDYFYPTSSVRTLYSPDHPYFHKLSLHVRITNCIRRNAVSELQSALEITRLLKSMEGPLKGRFPHFAPLEEPAYVSTHLDLGDPSRNLKINESFSLMLRKSFHASLLPETTPILSAYFFGNGRFGRDQLDQFLTSNLQRESWFESYLEELLPPLLFYFFEKGIMFEPHLQNTLIGMRNQRPVQILVRDLDNVRIVQGSSSAEWIHLHRPKIAPEVTYPFEQALDRFFYCLLVNHLAEAVYQLSFGSPALEKRLWDLLRESLLSSASKELDPKIKQVVTRFLQGKTLPGKANLITRFQRTPDQNANFVAIPNPMALESLL
jgi:siderophore synthetase component